MKYFYLATLCLSLTSCCGVTCPANRDISGRVIIGATEVLSVKEAELDFKARIDTGASITSIHAEMIRIHGGSENLKENVGKHVTFDTTNYQGEKHSIKTIITRVQEVKNSQGTEFRYVVELNIGKAGKFKKVEVNLRNRGKMAYELLIGRNWLKDDYLVNTDKL